MPDKDDIRIEPQGAGLSEEAAVLRLAAPMRKGLLGLVFSRLLIIALLVVGQIALYIMLVAMLQKYLPYYTFIQAAFVALMGLYLFNTAMDSSAKLTWMALIAVAPLVGAILLAFVQTNLGHRRIQRRTSELIEESRGIIPQDQTVLDQLKGDPYATDDLGRYINRSGTFPIFDETEITYFPIGEDKFAAMIEELEKAERFIFMEYFIIEEGYMWGRILDILARKVKEGLDVRVMYDGMCEISNLPHNYPKLLEKLGIKAKLFSPITPFISTHYNYRDHRKILVIDGKVAFNGGVNLADEYINRIERFGHWKDTAVMLKGKAVSSFTLMFLQMWNLTEKEASFPMEYLEQSTPPQPSPSGHEGTCVGAKELEAPCPGYVIPYGDCPLDTDKVGEAVYMDILARATDYVHIMTPYLILDGELETALLFAAQRGVDVKIILPGIPDKKTAYSLAKTHYKALTEGGVKLYEYTPGFVHAKVFVSDDKRAVVGTINLDYRSLYHHFECATYLYKVPCISEIEEDYERTLAQCRPVTAETIKNEKLFYKVCGVILKTVAPLM